MSKHNKNFISNTWYTNTNVLSHSNKDYKFYITIGSRGRGKTFSGKNYLAKKFIKRHMEHWNKEYRNGQRWLTVWGRLSQSAVDKVLENNGSAFFEPEILRRYGLVCKVIGDYIHFADVKSGVMKDDEIVFDFHPAIRVMAISKYYDFKGNQFTEFDEIIMDELVRAKGERRSFDISIAFKNFVENIARDRQDVRCIIYANAVEELNDLRILFHFIPLPSKFGMYFIQTNGQNSTIIEYLDDSEAWKRRKRVNMAGLLGSKDDSAFTNAGHMLLDIDMLVYRNKIKRRTLTFKLSDGFHVFAVMLIDDGRYLVDDIAMTPFITNTHPIYGLRKAHVSTKIRYDRDVRQAMENIWNSGKVCFPDMKIAKQFRSWLEEAKIIETI